MQFSSFIRGLFVQVFLNQKLKLVNIIACISPWNLLSWHNIIHYVMKQGGISSILPQVLHRWYAVERNDVGPLAWALWCGDCRPGPPEDCGHRCASGSSEGDRSAEARAPCGPSVSYRTKPQAADHLRSISSTRHPSGSPRSWGGGVQQHRWQLLLFCSLSGVGDPSLKGAGGRGCFSCDKAGKKQLWTTFEIGSLKSSLSFLFVYHPSGNRSGTEHPVSQEE